jgi:carbonic anhydrase/acetyltransferase-like protein (isoleucine patch superfamily)
MCGDVTIGSDCRILFGAQVIAEGGSITIGRECIVMENTVLRAGDRHPLTIGDNCLIGPIAHVVGCRIEDEVFVATGAAIFHGAHLVGKSSEVRVNAGSDRDHLYDPGGFCARRFARAREGSWRDWAIDAQALC